MPFNHNFSVRKFLKDDYEPKIKQNCSPKIEKIPTPLSEKLVQDLRICSEQDFDVDDLRHQLLGELLHQGHQTTYLKITLMQYNKTN